jgi:nicotinamide-nucleotide amidase
MFNDPIPALLHQLYVRLHARGEMLSTAESCTGGLLAGAATELTGASAWFDRGFVTYSNDAKMSLLGVQGSTLDTHGAVSEATAGEMVEGVLAGAPASSWALSTTGIAAPRRRWDERRVRRCCAPSRGSFRVTEVRCVWRR